MGLDVERFALAFSAVFAVSYLCWLVGHNAYIAATPDKRASFGISHSLGLTGEAGYIVALAAGLVIGNFFPVAAKWLSEAARPEWFIKTAIVILGASLGIKAAGATRLVETIMFRGLAAIIEAYLIYWALVYFVARRFFGFSREWAAPLASGISICGVSAAITTGAAIRARPIVPVMVSFGRVFFCRRANPSAARRPRLAGGPRDGRRRVDGSRRQNGWGRYLHRRDFAGSIRRPSRCRPRSDVADDDKRESVHRFVHRRLGYGSLARLGLRH
jgi:hypothetical protein